MLSILKIFLILLKKNMNALSIIDVALFCFFVTNNLVQINRELSIFIGVILIKKMIFKEELVNDLKNLFFISGVNNSKLIFMNFFLINFNYLLIVFILNILNITNLSSIYEGFYVLNLLLLIDFIIKYIIRIDKFIKHLFFVNLFNSFIYLVLFSFFLFSLNTPLLSSLITILTLFIIINLTKRTLDYNDIN